MGLTERHWFENEDVPENYEWALEDAVDNSRTNKKCHEVKRFENLMYKGCEPHWHCIYCDNYWPFHCYGKKDLEQMECPSRKGKSIMSNNKGKQNKNVDMVEVIRCKDCRWYDERISICGNCWLPREQTFFCADGKRR